MNYGIYAEGMYRSLHKLNALKVPIYITENGVADAVDDRRKIWIQRHLYAVAKAIEDNIDVRGFFYWSLMDNFGA
jgi:beta-glucosidase